MLSRAVVSISQSANVPPLRVCVSLLSLQHVACGDNFAFAIAACTKACDCVHKTLGDHPSNILVAWGQALDGRIPGDAMDLSDTESVVDSTSMVGR